ncbi:MAG TPA: class I SAM-dependent methyltransferase [Gemmatimonadaceae bacterium]
MTDVTSGAAFFDRLHRSEAEPWSFSERAAEVLRHDWIASTMVQLDCAPRRTLDVGCSLGQLTGRLAEALPDVYAIDVSVTALNEARRRMPPDAASFAAGCATSLPVASAAFDLIVASDGLYSWNLSAGGRRDALHELHRVLRPGGQILFTEHMRPEHFAELLEEVRQSSLRVLSVTFLYDRPWYQVESWFRAIQRFWIARALRRSLTVARALRQVGRLLGPRASRHICIVATRDQLLH